MIAQGTTIMRQILLNKGSSLAYKAKKSCVLAGLVPLFMGINHLGQGVQQDKMLAAPLTNAEFTDEDVTSRVGSGPSFRPSSDNPHPEETESSGVRNDALCSQDASSEESSSSMQALRAVVPENSLKLTASGRPLFWITLPQTQAKQLILSIEQINPTDNSKTFHGQKIYSVSQSPVLMGLSMPEEAPDLDVDAVYQWSVILVCGETPHPSDPFIFSTVKRMTPESAIEDGQPVQQSVVLSQAGFWYDPVSILLTAHLDSPEDQTLIESWRSLIQSAGLESMMQNYGPTKSAIQLPSRDD